MNKDIRILIVDDNSQICKGLKDILDGEGYKTTTRGTIALAKEELSNKFYSIVLVDLKLPDGSGLELLKEVKGLNKDTVVIVVTGFASVDSAISAMNEGAFAYLKKPLNIEELKINIKKALKMQELSLSNKELLNNLHALTLKDPLTGLYNYRYLRERLSSEFSRAKRYILPLSVIMLDVDYFKSINDIYGHKYGDLVLKELAQNLLKFTRGNDIVMRYGGEEFIILLPDTNKEGVVMLGQRILNAISEHVFDPHGNKIKIKVSMGIACFPEDDINTESELLDSADAALRNAKEAGGNRVAIFRKMGQEAIDSFFRKGAGDNIGKLKEKLWKMEKRVNQTLLESIYAFAKTIEAKDYYTGEHAESMVSIVMSICRELSLTKKETENMEHAAILHDLGKIGIPDGILRKKGKLTKREYGIIKGHPKIGAEIIRSIHFLSEVAPIVLYHHERFDGMGYSSGLKGKEIPLGARVIAVADVYQALISDRPYRRAYSKKEALRIISENSGTHFDPKVVKAFLRTVKEKK